MVTALATHNTLGRRDRPAGRAHALIFFGFGVLFIGTATITLDYDILQPLFGVAFWNGGFYLAFSPAPDLAAVGLIPGLLYMMTRRGWIRPPKLDQRRPGRAADAPTAASAGSRTGPSCGC